MGGKRKITGELWRLKVTSMRDRSIGCHIEHFWDEVEASADYSGLGEPGDGLEGELLPGGLHCPGRQGTDCDHTAVTHSHCMVQAEDRHVRDVRGCVIILHFTVSRVTNRTVDQFQLQFLFKTKFLFKYRFRF